MRMHLLTTWQMRTSVLKSAWMPEGTYLMPFDRLAGSVDDPDTEDGGDGILPGASSVRIAD